MEPMLNKDVERVQNVNRNPISTSTIINGYLPFKSTRSGGNKKWSKRRKNRKDYQKSNAISKVGGDYSLGSNFSHYPIPQSSCGSINHSFLNTSNQIEASIGTQYLTNLKPGRSYSQKRIPEKQMKKMMTSLEVSKVSSQAKLKINPESVRKSNDLLKLGKEKLIDKNYSEATKVFTDALSVNSMNFEAMFYRGITYLDSGNPKKAITELSLIIENAPMFKNTVYLVLSISYMRVNDVFAALKILTKAIKKYPRFIEAYLARGQIYTMLSKSYETGFKEFKNDANNNLFRNLSVGQINERVITDFQTVINLIPNKGLGYVGKADALRSIGDFAGALD